MITTLELSKNAKTAYYSLFANKQEVLPYIYSLWSLVQNDLPWIPGHVGKNLSMEISNPLCQKISN